MGMHFQLDHLDASLTEEELLQLIDQYNANDQFHGILVQLPLPKHISEKAVIERISPEKDVDGFHPLNIGKMLLGKTHSFHAHQQGLLNYSTKRVSTFLEKKSLLSDAAILSVNR